MHYNSIFISDIHLGAAYSQTRKALTFLKSHTANNLFLLGDIFDDHQDREADWISTSELIKHILLSYSYKYVVYVPGNHDPFVRYFFGLIGKYGKLHISNPLDYKAKNGKIYHLTHGDEFDWIKERLPLLFELFSKANHAIRYYMLKVISLKDEAKIGGGINHWLNNILMNNNFYNRLIKFAQNKKYDGIICGHFHEACIDKRPHFKYMNCGDWIDSCTAIVEDEMGNFKLIEWR